MKINMTAVYRVAQLATVCYCMLRADCPAQKEVQLSTTSYCASVNK